MKIVWLDGAWRNLAQISEYLAGQDSNVSVNVERRIISSITSLASFPEAGRPGRVAGTRELIISGYPYLIIYRVQAAEVQILRVLHTAQQWPV